MTYLPCTLAVHYPVPWTALLLLLTPTLAVPAPASSPPSLPPSYPPSPTTQTGASLTLPNDKLLHGNAYATPAATWATACKALQSNDLNAFRACFYNKNEISSVFLKSYSDTMLTTFRLARAAATLGPEGQALAAKLDRLTAELIRSSDDRTTTIVGNMARWSRLETAADGRKSEQIMYFHQSEPGQWLIDTEKSYALDTPEGRQTAEAYIQATATELPAMKQVIADIESKKITTYPQLQKRFAPPPKSK